jgi:uncharacterized membrane protein
LAQLQPLRGLQAKLLGILRALGSRLPAQQVLSFKFSQLLWEFLVPLYLTQELSLLRHVQELLGVLRVMRFCGVVEQLLSLAVGLSQMEFLEQLTQTLERRRKLRTLLKCTLVVCL